VDVELLPWAREHLLFQQSVKSYLNFPLFDMLLLNPRGGIMMAASPATKPGLIDEVDIPKGINVGLVTPSSDFLISMLGKPREVMSNDCQPITNRTLAPLMQTTTVGPFAPRLAKPKDY
jgi:hypothetical protein